MYCAGEAPATRCVDVHAFSVQKRQQLAAQRIVTDRREVPDLEVVPAGTGEVDGGVAGVAGESELHRVGAVAGEFHHALTDGDNAGHSIPP